MSLSRYYENASGERCRLYGSRPEALVEGEHGGRFLLSLQPVLCGQVMPEMARSLGWFDKEVFECFHSFIIGQGWVEIPQNIGNKKSARDQVDFRLLSLQALIEEGVGKGRIACAKNKIRKICEKAGLPIPELAQ